MATEGRPPRDPLAFSPTDESVQVALPRWVQSPSGGTAGSTATPGADSTDTFHPDAAASPAPVPTPESAAGRLDDLGVIAKGGFGSIHRVFDRNLRRSAAMKVIDPQKATNPNAVLRFVEEAQITGQLDHPNIVPVHDLGVDEKGQYFFTMKLVRGRTLTAILKQRDEAPSFAHHLDRVLDVLVRVCDALSFAHVRGVVHRDLKPDNIMVGSFGQVYVMDWGIARLTAGTRPSGDDEEVTVSQRSSDTPGVVIGTFSYMAPEQALGLNNQVDARTDVFALGALLYQALCGRPPYEGRTAMEKVMAAQKAQYRPAAEVAGRELPPALVEISERAMRADPAERHASVAEFREDLERFRRGGWFPTRTFPAGAMIVKEGEDADAAYIIVKGSCEAFKMEKGRKTPLRTMGPGDVFGETAIFTSKPRTASVRAVSSLTAMVVTRASLEEELGSSSWMGPFVRALAARFRELDAGAGVLRTSADENRVIQRATEHLAWDGVTHGDERRAAWGPLRTALAAETGKREDDLVATLEKSGVFHVDRAQDLITLRRRA